MTRQEIEDIIAGAIDSSLGPDWTSRQAAASVMHWFDNEGLSVGQKLADQSSPAPGSNEWLMGSPLFHPGDIA